MTRLAETAKLNELKPSRAMKVYVNDTPISVHRGCKAADAVRRYCAETGDTAPAEITDAYGNVIAEDSPMTEDRRIYTR